MMMLLHSLVAVFSLSLICTVISVDDGLLILAVNVTEPMLSLKLFDTSVNPTTAAKKLNEKYRICDRIEL